MAGFSFNGNKIITTSGGGMIASENEEYIKHATFLATQAKEPVRHYEHKEIGYNYRMSNITAGVGRGQLLHLDEHIAKKKAIYETYKDAFNPDLKPLHQQPVFKGANSILITKMMKPVSEDIFDRGLCLQVILRIQKKIWIGS